MPPAGPREAPPPQLPQVPAKGASPCLANGCSACCHDTQMLLTNEDVRRLEALRPGLPFAVLADDGYLQLRSRDAPPVSGMRGKPCVFLDEAGRCSVHAHRPEGCRLYPAMWDDDAGKAVLDGEHCPHTAGFLLPMATQDAVRRLAERLHAERDARVTGTS